MTAPHLHAPGTLWRSKDPKRPADAVDIGPGSPWATPFKAGRDGSREDIVAQFDRWVLHAPDKRARRIRKNIGQLAGRDLVCPCGTEHCHGGVLLTLAQLETCRPDFTPVPVNAGTWLRVAAYGEDGELVRFMLRVTDPGPAGVVLEASGQVRWMIGNPCSRIGDWLRRRQGSAVTMADVYAQAQRKVDKHGRSAA